MNHQPASPPAAVVHDACAELISTGRPVTFTTVAGRTGISRTTLYRRHDLRELIEQHREPAWNMLALAKGGRVGVLTSPRAAHTYSSGCSVKVAQLPLNTTSPTTSSTTKQVRPCAPIRAEARPR